jgi:predicted enzyme related to lactoylglutathione lyase
MKSPVIHFEVIGRDGKKLQQFYADLLGWQVDANNPMQYGLVASAEGEPGIGGGIGQGEAPMVTFYAQVEDLAAALKRAEELGGKTVMPPMEVPGGPAIAQFSDPEGNVVGLVKAM